MKDAARALDHLLIGAPTLEQGLDWLESNTGVRGVHGGSHAGLGTWNALASLGPTQYVEIIAPDPDQPGVETLYVPGLRDLPAPRVVSWAARGRSLASGFVAALGPEVTCEPVRRGSRVRSDGRTLNWSLAFPRHPRWGTFEGALPFFIEWDDPATHPGTSAPSGLGLRAMTLRHPRSEVLRAALASLGIDAVVEHAESESIRVELDTPRGVAILE